MTPSTPRILYIEDNPLEIQLISRSLKHMGYEMLAAEDARKGISLARMEKPDLILMDIHLPDMDGIAATHFLKESPELRHIPVVILSSDMTDKIQQASREAGCDAYLEKPVSKASLLRVVHQFVNHQAPV